jgi:hypothetical protein
MAEPAREEVITAAIAALEAGMTGTRPGWSGTYPNPVQFRRDAPPGDSVTHRPTIAVVADTGSTVEIEVTVGGQVGMRHAFNVSFVGYVKATNGVSAATWKQRLWDDFFTVLMAAGTLGGRCSAIQIGPLEDEWLLEPQGEWVQPATIVFHETKTVE